MREAEHLPAIRRIESILRRMREPSSPLRTMLSADVDHPPDLPFALDVTRMDRSTLGNRLNRGVVVAIRPQVYIAAPDDGARAYDESLLAEVRGITDRARGPLWFSHSTAAQLHGAWTYRTPLQVHVTHPVSQHVERDDEAVVVRHHTPLQERDRTNVGGVPVTSLARTLVDCIRTLPRTSAVVACDSLFRLGAGPWDVARVMSESRGKRGIVQAREVLELCDPRSASPGESVLRLVAADAGLPRPECQAEVVTGAGTFFLDVALPDRRVAFEFDGEVKYGGGVYGDPDEVRRAEADRQLALERAGWIVVRVRWDDLDDPVALEQRLRKAYAEAGRRHKHAALSFAP